MNPVVIAVAITGSVPRKKDNPAVPITPAEQIESTHEAFEAGATLVHIHVRNDDETPVLRPGAVRAGAGGRAPALPGHDRAVLDRRPRPRPGSARLALISGPTWRRSPPARSISRPSSTRTHTTLVDDLAGQDAGHRRPARDRDLRSLASSWRPPPGRGRPDGRAAACAVRHGREERHAGRRAPARHPAERAAARPAAGDLDRRRHRHQPGRGHGMGAGARRPMRCAPASRTTSASRKDRLAASNAELVRLAAETLARHGRRPATVEEARKMLGL